MVRLQRTTAHRPVQNASTRLSWGPTAERLGEHLLKGSAVFVEGSLQSRSWETPEGQKRNIVEVRAIRVQNLTKSSGEKEIPEESLEETQKPNEKGELPF